jgi:Rieske Fe-S protein
LVAGIAPGALAACSTAGVRKGGPGDAKAGAVLAKVSAIPVGGGALVNAGTNGLLLVVAPKAGQLKAYNPTCPHAGAIVSPPQNGIITCPAHGSRFNPENGAVEQGPAPTGLTSVGVTVSKGNVLLA